ncbi:hypothetical protein [Azospirillum endophyticum]
MMVVVLSLDAAGVERTTIPNAVPATAPDRNRPAVFPLRIVSTVFQGCPRWNRKP